MKSFDENRNGNMCDYVAGSITLETALVLPVFMLVMISLLSSIEILNEYVHINAALYQVGKEAAYYSYTYSELKEIGQLSEYDKAEGLAIAETFVRGELIRELGNDWLNKSMVEGSALGLHLYRSRICENNNDIDIVLTYKVKPWFSFTGLTQFYMENRCVMTAWKGYNPIYDNPVEGTGDVIVYVAENGEVYHTYRDCTYLQLSIQTVGRSQVENMRNDGGEKYYPCEYCMKKDSGSQYLYLTDWGNRYHSDISCSGLKRTVYEVRLSEVGNKGMCTKCDKRQVKGNGIIEN